MKKKKRELGVLLFEILEEGLDGNLKEGIGEGIGRIDAGFVLEGRRRPAGDVVVFEEPVDVGGVVVAEVVDVPGEDE